MNPTPLSQIATLAHATLHGKGDPVVSRVSTDSRDLRPGDLFVALRGDKFDGHDFVRRAAEAGATAAMVAADATPDAPEAFPLVRVDDTLCGLQRLAAGYRRTLPVRVVGVTGSNGKTGTKDLLAAVLGRRFATLKTAGNLNNQIGLPLTLLRCGTKHEIAIVEMGMSRPGDIAELAAIAAPDAAVITGIGVAHLEFMKTREAIAAEKGCLAEAVPAEGVVALPAEDPFFDALAARCRARVLPVGFRCGEIRARDICGTLGGSRFVLENGSGAVAARVTMPGEHAVRNALLAVAIGRFFGLTLEECAAGLADAELTGGRLQVRDAGAFDVLDDTYNANPDSCLAALETLARLPVEGRRIAVFGRMAELGEETLPGYARVGRKAGECGIDVFLAVGEETAPMARAAREAGAEWVLEVADTDAAASVMLEIAGEGDVILVKGSRSARMERIVEALAGPEGSHN